MQIPGLKVTVRELGLIGDSDWDRFNAKQNRLADLRKALEARRFTRSDPSYAALSAQLNADLGDAISLGQLAKRPGVSPDLIRALLPPSLRDVSTSDLDSVLLDSLYDGYLQSQKATIERLFQHDG
jgi:tRNA uridine 5-carboxymethylaminomethyl modification enzyme